MKDLKIFLMFLTIFTMAWLTGCASSPSAKGVSHPNPR